MQKHLFFIYISQITNYNFFPSHYHNHDSPFSFPHPLVRRLIAHGLMLLFAVKTAWRNKAPAGSNLISR
ncbi:MAG TPA: hypothetical protein VGN63_22470 [Flavisolibacter sp.]|jgi:hypothetical protein|nr:hypothetical protein [Flavisolibacter sp.]